MSNSIWTIAPETETYNLEWNNNQFWIEVKKRLNQGEKKRVTSAAFSTMSHGRGEDDNVQFNVNLEHAAFEKVRVWLVDWSLSDFNNNKLPVNVDTFRALGDVYDVIEKKIDEHSKGVLGTEKKTENPAMVLDITPHGKN